MQEEKCYCNRELSWLKFNERVLDEAGNQKVPLAERLTFASIYQKNLDEFYMVRVGILMDQLRSSQIIRENKTYMTSAEQIKAILKRTRELDKKKEAIYKGLMKELEGEGVRLINFSRLSGKEELMLEGYFDGEIFPFLSPMVVGKQQPFPFLKGGELYAVVLLSTKHGKLKLGIIPCSNLVFKRLIELPGRPGVFVLTEELILHFAPKLFKKYVIREKALVRVIRNADMAPERAYDEDLDYRDAMEHLIKKRKRLSPVRLELSREISSKMKEALYKYLKMPPDHIFIVGIPLELSFVFSLQSYLRGRRVLFYEKRLPQLSIGLNKGTLMERIEKRDMCLSYPFESIRPFIALLREAAYDESVVSIKMTLYRLAGKSKIVEALVEAAENNKEVIVLLELRARFDEESNIEWSKVLEDAGCNVIYGLKGYKVHSKLCLITRKTKQGISYITQIGTGNYNEETASLYTDLSLITADKEIGCEAASVFQALLMGETLGEATHLLVAPKCLKNRVLNMIEEEIQYARRGEAAYIGLKMNSLTDKAIIKKLIEASQAGVRIEMVIRGICCLLPGVEGLTENITVVSIVGRYLEHSRIYRFGAWEREKIYISSADFMTRNTARRVEVAVPVYDKGIQRRLKHIFDMLMQDNEKGKIENSAGDYEDRKLEGRGVDAQEMLFAEAYRAAEERKRERIMEISPSIPTLSPPSCGTNRPQIPDG